MTAPRLVGLPRVESVQPSGLVAFCASPTVSPMIIEHASEPWLELVQVDPANVLDFLSEPRLAALWVDASAPGGPNLTSSVKAVEPHLPILWSGDGALTTEVVADAVISRADIALRASTELLRLSQSRVYTRETLQHISSAVTTCAEEHGIESPRVSYFYKSNRASLGGVNAALVIEQEAVETVLVSGDPPGLRSLYRLSVPHQTATLAAMHDLAGEFANRIGGQLCSFSRRSTPLGTPVLFRGHESNLRALRGKPSIVACVEWESYSFYVQLVLRVPLASGRMGVAHPAGVVRFLSPPAPARDGS